MGNYLANKGVKTIRDNPLLRVRGIANYQFEEAVGEALFPDGCEFEISKRTGRIRRVSFHGVILATIRANDGRIVLTLEGGRRLQKATISPRLRVIVQKEVAQFVAEGRSVFAKYVLKVDHRLRAGDEVLVVDESDRLLAVGSAHLCPREMLDLSRGVAVRSRHHIKKRSP
jgi:predicted RNA-binding protein (TIGR00451 family)